MQTSAKIFVAGHRGLVGSAIVKRLQEAGYDNLVLRTRAELDLLNQEAVSGFFEKERPEVVVLSAAKVGGIAANSANPADFLFENLQIQNNVIWQAHLKGVKKLMFLGSSCIYPRECPQPMKEEYLLDGKPEPTNEGYALAKIVGLKLCEKLHKQYGDHYISCMPTNIYGPGDNFDLVGSHVLPAMIRRMHEAKLSKTPEVVIWGTGNSRRELLHVSDLADAVVFMLESYDAPEFLNIGTGVDVSIRELAELVQRVVGYEGKLVFDATKPDGMPRKLLDVSKLSDLGWTAKIPLEEGVRSTYQWFLENQGKYRG
jgi:GDP-L-fucose synthase